MRPGHARCMFLGALFACHDHTMTRIAWIAAGLVPGFLLGAESLHAAYGLGEPAAYVELARFGRAFELVRDFYASPVRDDRLIGAAIQGMVSGLDPHSRFIDTGHAAMAGAPAQGEFGGVGIQVEAKNGFLGVISLSHGAAQSKIEPGDKIEAIDGVSLLGLSQDEAIDRLRGPKGSKVTLTLVRGNEDRPFAVTRTRMGEENQALTYRTEGDVGYIRLPRFTAGTAKDLEAAVRALKRQIGPSLKGFILDLRDNPGGAREEAVQVADDFLNRGEILSIRGRTPKDSFRLDAAPGDIADGKTLVVLINAGTASAAEIVAGALKDQRRATIIGMVSRGNGLAESVLPLGRGALSLTTGIYITPSGRAIEDRGIVPDIAVAQGSEDDAPLFLPAAEAAIPPQLSGDPNAKGAKPPIFRAAPGAAYDDFQLAYARDLIQGTQTVKAAPDEIIPQIVIYFDVETT
jgi:carboxyl-terminal processing protease